MLSVIIPAYNEEESIGAAAAAISGILEKAEIPYELVFVNDGSTDGTWRKIENEAAQRPFIRGLRFSRNFGKEAAIYAGLAAAKGECCAVIDADLQHPPEKLVEMYRLWEDGYEVVEGVKASRGEEPAAYGAFAKLFYRVISAASGIDLYNASDFKLLDRKVVDILLSMQERNAFFRALSSWVGFRSVTVSYDVQERKAGTSKWSAVSLVKYALTNISSFSAAPLQLVTVFGVLMFAVSLVLSVIALYQKITGVALGGFTTIILLQSFTGSIIMISLGIIGFYLARIYEEIKGRPRYIIAETTKEE
ncbi:MAG: glycosyltransferase family 2 protein [Lachnospiraceae bacterium]|nr:glycosyltransferase family 2 protein [Lachnospiraceae bacterium]